jgi:hypothetical protein
MVLGIIAAVAIIGWIGLQVRPAPFASSPAGPSELRTVPLRSGLPAPVERYYRQEFGDAIPVIESAVISGRGTIRPVPFLPRLPIRFRFTHQAGQSYRHYIETTFFGLPFMKINEYYVNDKERMEMPWGVDENNPKLDQGGNLGMWAESILWLPSILVTDPRVRWEAIDDDTAWLLTPFGEKYERFLVRFDPATGKVQHWEVMRYKNGAGEKVPWIDGMWLDEGSPWASFEAEQVVYNVAVDTSVAAKGP